jgi:hypothetical protein
MAFRRSSENLKQFSKIRRANSSKLAPAQYYAPNAILDCGAKQDN